MKKDRFIVLLTDQDRRVQYTARYGRWAFGEYWLMVHGGGKRAGRMNGWIWVQ
jgi:hypothetical protein